MAELRNPLATRWDWDRHLRLNVGEPPFPRGITHADVDSETEINGHFLVLEGKRTGETISRGQYYTQDARVREGRLVIVVYGDPDVGRIDYLQIWPDEPFAGDWMTLWQIEHEWATWAQWAPRPDSRPCDFLPSMLAVAV